MTVNPFGSKIPPGRSILTTHSNICTKTIKIDAIPKNRYLLKCSRPSGTVMMIIIYTALADSRPYWLLISNVFEGSKDLSRNAMPMILKTMMERDVATSQIDPCISSATSSSDIWKAFLLYDSAGSWRMRNMRPDVKVRRAAKMGTWRLWRIC
jgi:hypothetical protein